MNTDAKTSASPTPPGWALLMIDFQRDFCAAGGYADQCWGVAWARAIIPAAARLLAGARASGVCIVHTREGYAPDLSDLSPLRRARSKSAGAEYGSPGPMGRLMVRGEQGQDIIPELAPISGEVVLDKPSYGAFATTAIDEILRQRGVQKIALAGVTADVCVHTTLREATDRGFDCFYVRDAISTPDPEIRQACERMVELEGGVWGQLVTVDEILSLWKAESSALLSGDPNR